MKTISRRQILAGILSTGAAIGAGRHQTLTASPPLKPLHQKRWRTAFGLNGFSSTSKKYKKETYPIWEVLDKARRALEAVTRLEPENGEAWNNLVALLAGQGKLKEALPLVKKAIEVQPGLASAHNNDGMILQRRGQNREARVALRRAIVLKPELPAPYFILARLCLSERDEDGAQKILEELLAIDPDQPEARRMLENMSKNRNR